MNVMHMSVLLCGVITEIHTLTLVPLYLKRVIVTPAFYPTGLDSRLNYDPV